MVPSLMYPAPTGGSEGVVFPPFNSLCSQLLFIVFGVGSLKKLWAIARAHRVAISGCRLHDKVEASVAAGILVFRFAFCWLLMSGTAHVLF